MFESTTTVLVTCLALGSLAVVLTLALLSMVTPEARPVRVRADDGVRAPGRRPADAPQDRGPGCNGLGH